MLIRWAKALAIGAVFGQALAASPPIHVELKAYFGSSDLLLEILENVALHNTSAYAHLFDAIIASPVQLSTPAEIYDYAFALIREGGLLEDDQITNVEFNLALRSASARVEAAREVCRGTQGIWSQGDDVVVTVAGKKSNHDLESDYYTYDPDHIASLIFDEADSASQLEPTDRTLGQAVDGKQTAVIHASSILSDKFRKWYEVLRKVNKEGTANIALRYCPGPASAGASVDLSGWGAELALKKTDYIVIDDRNAAPSEKSSNSEEITSETSDITPIPSSAIPNLALLATHEITHADDPLSRLVELSQNFPILAPALAQKKITGLPHTTREVNRLGQELHLPAGHSQFWINGKSVPETEVWGHKLTEMLREEGNVMKSLMKLGLSPAQAREILAHPKFVEAAAEAEPIRFDFRIGTDENGESPIIWLNDLEDRTHEYYGRWTRSVQTLLRPLRPGQIHPIAKNIHTAIVPVNLENPADLAILGREIGTYIQRGLPVRWGIVPYHYGPITKVWKYLREEISDAAAWAWVRTIVLEGVKPDASLYKQIVQGKPDAKKFDDIVRGCVSSIASAQWTEKLGINHATDSKSANIVIANGRIVSREEAWPGRMYGYVQEDVARLMEAVAEGWINDESDVVDYLLQGSFKTRNTRIFPADESVVVHVNQLELEERLSVAGVSPSSLPTIRASEYDGPVSSYTVMYVIADFLSEQGWTHALEAQKFLRTVLEESETRWPLIRFVHNPDLTNLHDSASADWLSTLQNLGVELETTDTTASHWKLTSAFVDKLGLKRGQAAVVINGRVIYGDETEILHLVADEDGNWVKQPWFSDEDFHTLYRVELSNRIKPTRDVVDEMGLSHEMVPAISSIIAKTSAPKSASSMFGPQTPDIRSRPYVNVNGTLTTFDIGNAETAMYEIVAVMDPLSPTAQKWSAILKVLSEMNGVYVKVILNPNTKLTELPIKRFYRHVLEAKLNFDGNGNIVTPSADFSNIPTDPLLTLGMDVLPAWHVTPKISEHDLDNIRLASLSSSQTARGVEAVYELKYILIDGHARDVTTNTPPRGMQLVLGRDGDGGVEWDQDTMVMANLGYFQFKARPGVWRLGVKEGWSQEVFEIESVGGGDREQEVVLASLEGKTLFPRVKRKAGMEKEDVLAEPEESLTQQLTNIVKGWFGRGGSGVSKKKQATINVFSVASGHLYERFLGIMIRSVLDHTEETVKFWFIENFLSPSFKYFLPHLAEEFGFQYELVTYKWPHWLRGQSEKQREIWGYKILFLDVLFPLDLDKIIFVDADQVVRADLKELIDIDLQGAPYGMVPMGDSRAEMEGFRFWKQGWWKSHLRGKPYHISALYVVDLNRFRTLAAGDRLRQQYHSLSADPNSLSNLDQDLPNNMQHQIPIYSLGEEWLWCETWCSDETLRRAKTIDLCNNPLTKEPKLERARRVVGEWVELDERVAEVARKVKEGGLKVEKEGHDEL
ncbi:killer toxin resistant protein [Saitoella coloradoensis]